MNFHWFIVFGCTTITIFDIQILTVLFSGDNLILALVSFCCNSIKFLKCPGSLAPKEPQAYLVLSLPQNCNQPFLKEAFWWGMKLETKIWTHRILTVIRLSFLLDCFSGQNQNIYIFLNEFMMIFFYSNIMVFYLISLTSLLCQNWGG